MTFLTYPFANVRLHARPEVSADHCIVGLFNTAVTADTATVHFLKDEVGLGRRTDDLGQVLPLLPPLTNIVKGSI